MPSDVAAFSLQFDTSVVGPLLSGFNPPTWFRKSARPSNGGTIKREERTATAPNEDILQIERMIGEVLQELEARTIRESDLEIPEVFDLRPSSTQRVIAKIRRTAPAQFYFVADDTPPTEEYED